DPVRVAGESGDPDALARAHAMLGMLSAARGDHDTARRHLEQSLTLAEALPDPSARVAALNNLALAHRATGEVDLAVDHTRTALELCTRQGDRPRDAALHNNLADHLPPARPPATAGPPSTTTWPTSSTSPATTARPWTTSSRPSPSSPRSANPAPPTRSSGNWRPGDRRHRHPVTAVTAQLGLVGKNDQNECHGRGDRGTCS